MKHPLLLLCAFLIVHNLIGQKSNDALTLEKRSYTSYSGKEVIGFSGSLKVPENRNNPDSEAIAIHFVQLKSTNPNPQAPLIYLEGGPGSSCSWQADDPRYLGSWLPYLEVGDVILLDQRGTGAGRDRVLYIWRNGIPEDVFASAEASSRHATKIGNAALEEFNKRGVDLNGYTTIENANDIDALRQALGYDKINLFGFSYGTHLGQAYIKYYEDYVENAVLVGVEGPNHTFKLPLAMDVQFRKIALMAKEDPNINKEVPDLVALYEKVVQKLEKKPIELEVQSPLTQSPMKVQIGAYGLNLMMRFDIGDASDLPVFPRLLYTIDQGDYSHLRWFVQKRITSVFGVQGMSSTMDPASGASPSRLARIKEEKAKSYFKNVVNPRNENEWPHPDLGEEFRAPLTTHTRTLFMSGTLDFNTPPHQAEEVRWGYSNSNHIIVKNAGHEQILTHPKATETIVRFLKGENIDDVALTQPKLRFIPVKGETSKLWHPSMGRK